MVVASLTLGALVGVALSGGFIWWEVGRYATPQVPQTLFDERKVLAAYTVGLFVGIPIAAAYLLLTSALANGALPGAAVFLAGIVVGTEVAQLLLGRSKYWGSTPSAPFYAVSLRAGVGGILALAAMAAYLGSVGSPSAAGLAASLLDSVALLALSVAGAFLSLRMRARGAPRTGSPLAGGLFAAVAFFLLGIGPAAGFLGALAAPLIVLAGASLAFRSGRRILAEVPPPSSAPPLPSSERPPTYGRTTLPSSEVDRPDGSHGAGKPPRDGR